MKPITWLWFMVWAGYWQQSTEVLHIPPVGNRPLTQVKQRCYGYSTIGVELENLLNVRIFITLLGYKSHAWKRQHSRVRAGFWPSANGGLCRTKLQKHQRGKKQSNNVAVIRDIINKHMQHGVCAVLINIAEVLVTNMERKSISELLFIQRSL